MRARETWWQMLDRTDREAAATARANGDAFNEDSPALCEWGPDVSHTIGDARPCADASRHGRDYPCAGFCVDGLRRGWIGREHCRLLCAIG